ncbi:hypothetical protein Ade02nite_14540 [Paractinoplanes deccanensis]|uniref:Uncharacterized protein n=1 Tax=Paractinoplanes deccanensis TaxID=113561 RepID=A0ABQ3XYJ2_9ACTN|nr:hypothetical protein [Actinoplanes deccanensis]GID72813.1 hypothetical protein Ade02nite_14540 [Actinoplanes deccanensis]
MTAGSIVVSGRDPSSARGDVIGVFEVVDLQLRVVAAKPLVNGGRTRIGSLDAGGYFTRATFLTNRRLSVPVEVPAGGGEPVAVVLEDSTAAAGLGTPSGDGWVAGWIFDRAARSWTPAGAGSVRRRSGTTIVMTADAPSANVLLQWAVGPQPAMFTVVRADAPVRVVSDASLAVLDLASGPARALFTFLHAGDLPAAGALAMEALSQSTGPDPAAAVAVGYYLLRRGDDRLGSWAAELTRLQPGSFDAHLLYGLALMRDKTRWPGSRGQRLTATRLGLPMFSHGLRLLDDALRLLLHGTTDEELTAARLHYVPYLRACLNRPLTTFWGGRPSEPALMPARTPEPVQARPLRLEGLTPTLPAAPTRKSTGKTKPLSKMTLVPEKHRRITFGPYSVPLTPATRTSATLALPAELAEALDTPLRGAAERTGQELMVIIGNVASGADDVDIEASVWLENAGQPVVMERRGSAMLAALPYSGSVLPAVLHLRGSYLIRSATTVPRPEPATVVTASGSPQAAALAREAERLVEVGLGWEDAQARLTEIAQEWPPAAPGEAATDRALWRRFVAAREEFQRRHRPAVVIEAKPRTRPRGGSSADGGPATFATVRGAELHLRDLLTEVEFRGPTWHVVSTAASAYCVATVVAWLRAGHVPRPCHLDRPALARLEGRWYPSHARRVAEEVAKSAIAYFRDRRLAWGLWRVEAGTTLVTELLDGCVLALPPALRSAAARSQYQPTRREEAWPAVEADGTDPISRSAAVLRGAGYTRAEVAEVLGLAGAAAVTRAVARHRRQKERSRSDGGAADV